MIHCQLRQRTPVQRGQNFVCIRDKLSRLIEDTAAKAAETEFQLVETSSPRGNSSMKCGSTNKAGCTWTTPEVLFPQGLSTKLRAINCATRTDSNPPMDPQFLQTRRKRSRVDIDCASENEKREFDVGTLLNNLWQRTARERALSSTLPYFSQ